MKSKGDKGILVYEKDFLLLQSTKFLVLKKVGRKSPVGATRGLPNPGHL